jgi:hypothetical protein
MFIPFFGVLQHVIVRDAANLLKIHSAAVFNVKMCGLVNVCEDGRKKEDRVEIGASSVIIRAAGLSSGNAR